MVNKILNILHKEIGSLHQAAYLLGVFAFLSQVLALVRDRLLAHFFGASQSLDVYFAAFRVPDFIFVAIASIVSVSVLIPFLAERIDTNFRDAQRFVDQVFTFFFFAIVVVSGIVYLVMPWLLALVFPGFSGAAFEQLVVLSRILLLSPVLLGVSNLFASVTQIHRRFFIYAISPLLYNIGIIAGILFFRPLWGVTGVAIGVIAGAAMHAAIQVPFVMRAGLFPRPRISLDWPLIRRVLTLSFPRAVTLGSNHLVLLVLLGIASTMGEGSIAVFSFAHNLQSVPLAIVGVSYSLAAFPTLSRLFVGGEHEKFLSHIVTAARHIIFWSVPVTVMFIVLRAHIVRVILGSGPRFDWTDTRLVAAALALFALSVVFQSLILLFVRAYYSAGNTKTPLFIAVVSGVFTIVFAGFLYAFSNSSDLIRNVIEAVLRVDGLTGTEVLLLPLAFTVGQSINALALWLFFERDFASFSGILLRTFAHSTSAGVFAGITTWVFLRILDVYLPLTTVLGVFLHGFLSGVAGIVVGVCVLLLLKNEELREAWATLHRKFWKKSAIVGPDADLTS